MPKNVDKKPKKRIWPFLKLVTFLKAPFQKEGNKKGTIPSNKNTKPIATNKLSGNYFFSEFLKYLKKSELASRTIISSLLLKLFL